MPIDLALVVTIFQLILIANKIGPVVALIDHRIVAVWFPVLINRLRILPINLALIVTSFQLISMANETTPAVG